MLGSLLLLPLLQGNGSLAALGASGGLMKLLRPELSWREARAANGARRGGPTDHRSAQMTGRNRTISEDNGAVSSGGVVQGSPLCL